MEGAGSRVANGLYRREGQYNGAPVFKKGGWWVVRYTLPSGGVYWYICDGAQLDVDDGDLYRVRDSGLLPPEAPPARWNLAKDGQLPVPTIRLVLNSPDAETPPPASVSSPPTGIEMLAAALSSSATLHYLTAAIRAATAASTHHTTDREAASSMVAAGATANTTEGNSRASRESGVLCSHSHGESIATVGGAACEWETPGGGSSTAAADETPRISVRLRLVCSSGNTGGGSLASADTGGVPASANTGGGLCVASHLSVGTPTRLALAEQLGAAVGGGGAGRDGGADFASTLLLAASNAYPSLRWRKPTLSTAHAGAASCTQTPTNDLIALATAAAADADAAAASSTRTPNHNPIALAAAAAATSAADSVSSGDGGGCGGGIGGGDGGGDGGRGEGGGEGGGGGGGGGGGEGGEGGGEGGGGDGGGGEGGGGGGGGHDGLNRHGRVNPFLSMDGEAGRRIALSDLGAMQLDVTSQSFAFEQRAARELGRESSLGRGLATYYYSTNGMYRYRYMCVYV